MRRALFQLVYLARAALRGLRASPVTSTVATATLAIALLLAGTFLLVLVNMGLLLERVERELQVTAYLRDGVSVEEQRELAQQVAELDGVEEVEIVSKEEALRRFRERAGGAALLEGIETNPLPASLEVRLASAQRSPDGLRAVARALAELPGVDDLGGGQQWVEGYARARALVRGIGVGLGAVLALATLLIVANTIRLTLHARRDELEILALVGASRAHLRVPFLIEGVIQGTCAGALALGLLFVLFHLAVAQLGEGLELFLGWSHPVFLSTRGIAWVVGGGAALGLFGAAGALAGERLP
jgi:cell division transport system permease protein